MRANALSILTWETAPRRGLLPATDEILRDSGPVPRVPPTTGLVFELPERHIGETLVFASIGLAGVVMVLFAAAAVLDVILSLAA